MLTVSNDRRDLVDAVRSGAAGYLTKDLRPEALQRAVRGIRSGDLAMSRSMAADVIQHVAASTNRQPPHRAWRRWRASAPASGSALLAEGLTDREIGERLGTRRARSRRTWARCSASWACGTARRRRRAIETGRRGRRAARPGPG